MPLVPFWRELRNELTLPAATRVDSSLEWTLRMAPDQRDLGGPPRRRSARVRRDSSRSVPRHRGL